MRIGFENPRIHSKIVSEGDMPSVCHQFDGSSSGSWFSSRRNGEAGSAECSECGETQNLVVKKKAQIPVTKASGG